MGTNIRPEDIFRRSQVREVLETRALYCYLAKERGGMNGRQLERQLRLTSGAISNHSVLSGIENYMKLTNFKTLSNVPSDRN